MFRGTMKSHQRTIFPDPFDPPPNTDQSFEKSILKKQNGLIVVPVDMPLPLSSSRSTRAINYTICPLFIYTICNWERREFFILVVSEKAKDTKMKLQEILRRCLAKSKDNMCIRIINRDYQLQL